MAPFRRCLIFCWCSIAVFGSLNAAYIPLKGANGHMVEFQVEAVEADGLRATRKGGYKEMLLKWEHIDLNWLRINQPELWKEKALIGQMKRRAYEGINFGMSKNQIIAQVNQKNGVRLPNEALGEKDESVLWVCYDAEALRQFFRFEFDKNDLLESFEVHHNFDEEKGIGSEMEAEWKRLNQLVEGFRSELASSEALPSDSDWRRLTKRLGSEKTLDRVTHRWEDAEREFELAVAYKAVDLGVTKTTEGKITFFGKEITVSNTAETHRNWVVLRARRK